MSLMNRVCMIVDLKSFDGLGNILVWPTCLANEGKPTMEASMSRRAPGLRSSTTYERLTSNMSRVTANLLSDLLRGHS